MAAHLATPVAGAYSPSVLRVLADLVRPFVTVAAVMTTALCLLYFPWSSDAPLSDAQQRGLKRYYATAYDKVQAAGDDPDSSYVRIAKEAAEKANVKSVLQGFVNRFGLANKKVLDIGAGRGYLQDVVNDYTALDISATVKRFFHKPFVLGSATLMPFAANQFDAAWTIWVLEHVPNPEAALLEMRRVVKNNGLLYIAPAWDCTPWAAAGYPVRPYSDFGWNGKLIKASIPVQLYLKNLATPPVRLLRYASWKLSASPATFRYTRLEPNYSQYWMPDSDAVNSLDRYETALWFLSRGDECLNCEGALNGLTQAGYPLIVRIHK